jgi:hypothetical protein
MTVSHPQQTAITSNEDSVIASSSKSECFSILDTGLSISIPSLATKNIPSQGFRRNENARLW